ncbi:AMP-binding protein [Acinetobacter sp. ASP199]|uniref:AMP-binding protein n=1 Tax=unclassified Acinetobacter TaxID=196816 RepID=UPI001F624F25|nr:AMP-binding protein [Acinetobacter sp. ASP199]UNT58798.1 AMP-binding protein [Acinetobacter sp. ASP199]
MSCHFKHHVNSSRLLCVKADLTAASFQVFWQDVQQQAAQIQPLAAPVWALWEQDSYEFLVLFFAALQAGKQVLLPPHRVSELERELAAEQIYFLKRLELQYATEAFQLNLDDSFLQQAQVYFYTSGSTGQPKKIPRTLAQLFNEVAGLDASFSLQEDAIAIATVSHQHIYGLLFKLLWPLASGRGFYQSQLAFPENVADIQKKIASFQQPNYVISSPALLKRWTPEVLLQDCLMVYSSGGKLDAGVRPHLNSPITEVFGSSETGGIAHRQADDALWKPFANVEVGAGEHSELMVRANHAYSLDWILTGDKVELTEPENFKSTFKLLGRLDRIVKLEEKRLSLDAIEQCLSTLETVQQSHVLVYEKQHRQILAAVVVLTEAARTELMALGKARFVAQLKAQLNDKLESIAIPRQWRFLSKMPQNAQSKLNKHYLKSLFLPMQLPVVLSHLIEAEQISYQLEFSPELTCFKGHFPAHPIYPGVGQIGFIQYFALQNWADLHWCNGMEQLKFQDLIRPWVVVQLVLIRKAHKVIFELRDGDKILASGRLLFALEPQPQPAG